MHKPSPYPQTDSDEVIAVQIFESSVNIDRVKTDIKVRDKYPNIDGTVELVDSDRVPLGKLDVQVRKIPDGALKYSCPVSLAGYSQVTTLPLILVCVDILNKRVFWRHIDVNMPEYKPNNKSNFVIHFDLSSDLIDEHEVYISKWLEITSSFRKKVSGIESLPRPYSAQGLTQEDIRHFQMYVGKLNSFLENDFQIIKNLFFRDIWKLGVGVFHSDEESISFQLYNIPYGKDLPLVCKINFSDQIPNGISTNAGVRSAYSDPAKMAEEFIFRRIRSAVKNKHFILVGKICSEDVIFTFVDKFSLLLGIDRFEDEYSVDELSKAINKRLLDKCASMLVEKGMTNSLVHLQLELVENYFQQNSPSIIQFKDANVQFTLAMNSYGSISFPVVLDALRNVTNSGTEIIKRPFKQRDYKSIVPGNNFVWSGFTFEDEIFNVRSVFDNVLSEYAGFVERNMLNFPQSPYLDNSTALIVEYAPVNSRASRFGGGEPGYTVAFLPNTVGELPKLSFCILDSNNPIYSRERRMEISFNNSIFQANRINESAGGFLLTKLPLLNLMYELLEDDLELHYGSDSIRGL